MLGAVVAAGSSLVLLAGCAFFGQPVSSAAPATNVPSGSDAFAAYFTQTVTWTRCEGGDFLCATVTAPLDWNDASDTRTIDLAVIRHPATGSSRVGSLFVNPGGPGASGYDFVRDGIDYLASTKVEAAYDVVGWDPRGVGQSTAVACTNDPAQIAKWLYPVSTVDPETNPTGWVNERLAAAKAYTQTCVQNSGDILEFIDTVQTVHDLELLRVLSGDTSLHYLGFSYGTQLGQEYLRLYPETAGRVVLDGVVDPTESSSETVVAQMGGFELALTHFVEQCPTRYADCPLGGGTAAGLAKIHALLESFQARPVTSGGRTMTGEALEGAILQALYGEGYWKSLDQMLIEVSRATPVTSTAWALVDQYNDFSTRTGYTSNLQDAFRAISCLDSEYVSDQAELDDMQTQLLAVAPTLTLDLPVTPDTFCATWPFGYQGTPHTLVTAQGSAPILVVSTTGDPATPYEGGVKVASALASGVLLTYDGEGHTAYNRNANACVVAAVDAYLISGAVPQDGTTCKD